MKNIVLSAIAALMVMVGVYHSALLMGASELVAVFAAAVVAAAFGFAVVAATAFVVVATAAFVAVGAAEQTGVRYGWALPVYLVEGLAIWGALTVGSAGWSVAIALGGAVALLALWQIAPKPTPEQLSAV